jgi:hypothetical protein
MIYRMELLYAKFRELTEEYGRPIDYCVHIIDVEGYGPKHLWKPGVFNEPVFFWSQFCLNKFHLLPDCLWSHGFVIRYELM